VDGSQWMVNPALANQAATRTASGVTPQQIMEMAAGAGVMTPELALKYSESQSDAESARPEEIMIGGQPWVFSRKTGAFQRNNDPLAFMNGMAGGGVPRIPVTDEDGTPTGEYMIPNGRGGFVKGRADKKLAQGESWIFSADADEFRAGVEGIKDAEQLRAVLELRAMYNRAQGKDDPMKEFLAQYIAATAKGGKGSAAPKSKPAPAETATVKPKWRLNPETRKLEPIN
jgi:hypothetical protein